MPNRYLLGMGGIALALSMTAASPMRAAQNAAVAPDELAADKPAACAVQAAPHCDDAAAQYGLGLMFKDGQGVPSDPLAAHGWFLCAARSDGQIGRDAAQWAERLSSSLGGPAVLAAQEKRLGCRRLAEIAPRLDSADASPRPGPETPSIWKTLGTKLDQFTEALSRFEIPGPDAGAPAHQTAAPDPPKFSTSAAVAVPDRRSVWSRVFFLPADGTVIGSQHLAWELGAEDMFRDMRDIAREGDDITLGLFAVFWWALIGKTLLSVGRAILGPSRRSGARGIGQSGFIGPRR